MATPAPYEGLERSSVTLERDRIDKFRHTSSISLLPGYPRAAMLSRVLKTANHSPAV